MKKNGPGGGESFEPVIEVPVRTAGEDLLLVFHMDENGNPLRQFVNNSPAAHPPGTVRLLNLSASRAAFTAGGGPVPVQPGKDATSRPVPRKDGRFPLVCSIETPGGGVYQSPEKLLQFRRPGNRLLVIVSPQPFDVETGQATADGAPVMKRVHRPEPVLLPDTVPGVEGNAAPVATPAEQPPPQTPAVVARDASEVRAVSALLTRFGSWWQNSGELLLEFPGGSAPLRLDGAAGNSQRITATAGQRGEVRITGGGIEMASGKLPEGAREVLIALAAPPDAQGACSLAAFDNSPQSHPPGARRIFNLTPYQLAYSRGGGAEAVYVNPKESAILDGPAAAVKLALQTAEGWVLLGSLDAAPPPPGTRTAVFVYPEGGNGKFAFLETTL